MTTPPSPRRVRLTRKQLFGLPVLLGVPIAAAVGVLGGDRRGVVARVAFVFVFTLACFRVLGKRELSQMAPFEIVMLFLVPQLFKNALTRNDNSLETAVVGALTLFALVIVTSLLRYRSDRVGRIVQARPTVLAHDGVLAHVEMDRERITPDDILTAMHMVGLERFDQVKWALLEASGRISVIPRTPIPDTLHAPTP
jgi:uncharacterized membrane protein YcaP (DUF421 family)